MCTEETLESVVINGVTYTIEFETPEFENAENENDDTPEKIVYISASDGCGEIGGAYYKKDKNSDGFVFDISFYSASGKDFTDSEDYKQAKDELFKRLGIKEAEETEEEGF